MKKRILCFLLLLVLCVSLLLTACGPKEETPNQDTPPADTPVEEAPTDDNVKKGSITTKGDFGDANVTVDGQMTDGYTIPYSN